ncbi:geranylgeranyl pyrophosphate synthase/geranyltranstransferase [Cenarchaeum symbiosum A]|uniref:Geranylgeranyl pyrophosphate synthase/geranyltranstransferase n=1 Tax=Cenarchaeum symbiosum (strain A) TaxID=414004 RepID=A0RY76_CENSY|nr:geranylgeranyl pyrophosphate synthase/geranyltranstransferase [Cenarchaeum symbiosum A]
MEEYGPYIGRIDAALEAELALHPELELTGPLRYAITGGKRIRPIILVLAAESVGSADDNTYAAACAVELLHTESVIHDDIIDDETMRRHKDPFHIKYGQNTSILTGDFVLGLILKICSRLDNVRIADDLSTTAMMMSEGEAIEGRLENSGDVTFDDYLKVIEYKTATAFEVASKIGAILGGGSERQVEDLTGFGKNIGIAYQIKDDLNDWKNEDKLFNLLIKKSKDPRDIFDRMEEMLGGYSDKALACMRGIPEGAPRSMLETLVEFTKFKA